MAWTRSNPGFEQAHDLTIAGTNAGTSYSSVIDFLGPKFSQANRYVTVLAKASATPASTAPCHLQGTIDGTNYVTIFSTIFAGNLTSAYQSKVVDLNAYPALKYRFAIPSGGDDSAKTFQIQICG